MIDIKQTGAAGGWRRPVALKRRLVPQMAQRRLVLLDLGETPNRLEEIVVGKVVVDRLTSPTITTTRANRDVIRPSGADPSRRSISAGSHTPPLKKAEISP